MTSISLAAGYATRMYPLTRDFPKPLLTVGDGDILTRLLVDLDGIEEITRHVVVTNHRFIGHFEQWKEKTALKKPLVLIDDGTMDNQGRLGAVKDMQLAIDALALDEDLLVLAADNVLDFSLSCLVKRFAQTNSSCVLCYEETDPAALKRCGVLTLDAQGKVLAMVEKPHDPPTRWACPPFYLYHRNDARKIRQAIDAGISVDAPGSLVAYLCDKTAIYASPMPGKRYDVGDLQGYEALKSRPPQFQT